jgi:glycerol-3-phosphate dehydrogenase
MISIFKSLSNNVTMTRQQRLQDIAEQVEWDVIIVGGGITGAGILKRASQMKLKVLLLEQKDFAWGSSSRSSKMVHGGLRYMAQGQFKLTKESVRERQRLLSEAHPLVNKQSFAMSHYKGQFPWPWLFNQLLNVYDFIADIKQHKFWQKQSYLSLVPKAKESKLLGGTQFFDALTEDARLVQRLIQESLQLGGQAINYTKVTGLINNQAGVCGVTISTEEENETQTLKSKMVINACGAWTNQLTADEKQHQQKMRPLRGSHLVIASWRLPVASVISVLHPTDNRPVQIYPWQNVTIVGTTDVDHDEKMHHEAQISQQEFDYLMQCISHQFPDLQITTQDIISTFSGIRPVLASDERLSVSKEKRDHSLVQTPGLISVTGGKLTTFRLIAQQVIALVAKAINCNEINEEQAMFDRSEQIAFGKIAKENQQQILASYGAFSAQFIIQMTTEHNQSISYSRHLWAELIWAVKYEQVLHLDDLLLRRTRIGNVLPEGAIAQINKVKALCSEYLAWSEAKWQAEITRYIDIWQRHYSLPNENESNIR